MIGDLFQTFDSPRPDQSGLDQKTPRNAEGAPWLGTTEVFSWSASAAPLLLPMLRLRATPGSPAGSAGFA
jgi:hypothetical protein